VGRVPLKEVVRESTDMIERLCIEAALELTGDNRASAAELLGLSRQSLYVKLRRYGLSEPGAESAIADAESPAPAKRQAKSLTPVSPAAGARPRTFARLPIQSAPAPRRPQQSGSFDGNRGGTTRAPHETKPQHDRDGPPPRRPARPQPKAMLEVLHPITWFPPMWAFTCGVVSSGVNVARELAGADRRRRPAGPLVCATSQAVNDWYDRHVDAINEPNRPIPSGRLPGRWGYYIAIGGTLLSLAAGRGARPWVLRRHRGRPDLRLDLQRAAAAPQAQRLVRQRAVGFSYESLAWITGAAVMLGGAMPDWRILCWRSSTASAPTAS
jgi:hypothetical protein